ncbi:MAG: hypothetical protein MZW92_38485 [Comamonadaceae bacterium]|nr:hypothetical protein [Comamonadaceae bacterium]
MKRREGSKERCRIFYARRPEMETAEEKLAFLGSARLSDIGAARRSAPDSERELAESDAATISTTLMPVAEQGGEGGADGARRAGDLQARTLGVVTNRDEWVYDRRSREARCRKIRYSRLESRMTSAASVGKRRERHSRRPKWGSERGKLERRHASRDASSRRAPTCVIRAHTGRISLMPTIASWPVTIGCISKSPVLSYGRAIHQSRHRVLQVSGTNVPFGGYASSIVADSAASLDAARRRSALTAIDEVGRPHRQHHRLVARPVPQATTSPAAARRPPAISKEAIFHYVYAVLHDPSYREKYAQNLKREFPRIPLYGGSLRRLLALGRTGARQLMDAAHRLRVGRALRR